MVSVWLVKLLGPMGIKVQTADVVWFVVVWARTGLNGRIDR